MRSSYIIEAVALVEDVAWLTRKDVMGRGDTSLANSEYDNHLAKQGRTRELRQRHIDRVKANKGFSGWHFGLGEEPVRTRDKGEFKRELEKRGLMMRDDVKRNLK